MHKVIHYSRNGYNGDYTYTSVCGKKVKTHQDNEESTIYPEQANCKKCQGSKEYIIDLHDYYNDTAGINRRIYIESDILQADELLTSMVTVSMFLKESGAPFVERVFSRVIEHAWHDLENTWKEVKAADEIYADSSLMPLCGGSYMGAPVIFNSMCERAVKEGVKGKSVFILNQLDNIYWDMIDEEIMKKAFKHNTLYMHDDDYELVKINVAKIKF